MKQKIEQLAKGIFQYQLPDILISMDKVTVTAVAGSTYHGCFTICNRKGSRMKGVLYSSSRLFVLSDNQFIGEENIINFRFVADFVDPGEHVNGEISIITDCGETLLPFEVTVIPPYCESSMGVIRDLYQFTNLAKANWAEAEQIFYTDEFEHALRYFDKKYVVLYQHLKTEAQASQALEEFLVAIRKKLPITLTVDKSELEYTPGAYSFLDKIQITRNTWGHAALKIESNVPFLRPERTLVLTEAFTGNSCEVGFVVEPDKMHAGLNCGTLTIEGVSQKLQIPVVCHCKGRESTRAVKVRRRKQYEKKLMQNYLKFRLNKISTGKYTSEAENILLGLGNARQTVSVTDELIHIHLFLAEGKETQARAAIAALEEKAADYRKNPVVQAAILYLSALAGKQPEVIERAGSTIWSLRQQYPEKWELLWFLLYVDKSLLAPSQKLAEIKQQCLQGIISPMLYYEAAVAINEAPAELKALGVFELQILNFAVRYQYLSKETCARLTYLAVQEKDYNPLMVRVLKRVYERFRDKELLAAICQQLIAGAKTGPQDFPWYELGVKEQLKVVGIQEHYILSCPEDISRPLEHSALNFFAYQCELPEEKKAFLYANIVKHRTQYAFILQSYEKQIIDFTVAQLAKAAISQHLAVLYDDVLPRLPLTGELARQIPEVCFYYEIECKSPAIAGACVAHKEITGEVCTPLRQGRAYIEMYTENAEVFLTDAEGNRYLLTVDYSLNKLVHLEAMFEPMLELLGDNPKLLLNLAEKVQYYQNESEAAVELRKRVSRIPDLKAEYVRDYIRSLIYYYYENYEGELLESYLLQIDLRFVERAERVKLIEFMIVRDLYNVALKAMAEYGFEGIDVKRLAKLCSRLILNAGGMEKVEVLVAACYYVFQAGKYDEIVLKYLTDYYYGTTAEMYEIWKAARTLEIDTLDLEERLLAQMLFAESYIGNAKAVFCNYYRTGMNKKLIRAFLSYYAYKYLLNDRLVEQEIFDIMRKEIGFEDNEVCLLAVMKYYSTREQLTDAEVNFVDYHLCQLEQRGIILPFFREFKGSMRIPQNLYDKYYVEYRTDPKNKVVIHYTFEDERGETGFKAVEMTNVCYGIFVKEFVLFCNESLQYYITETGEDTESITESTQVRLTPEQTGGEDTKYYQLNLIITSREMQDEKTALKLMENYVKTDYAISQLFHPL